MEELIAKRYAKALMDLCDEKSLDGIIASLEELSTSLKSEKVKELVANPLISSSVKFETLVAPLKGKIDEKLYRLLEIMSENGRLDLIPELASILEYERKLASNSFVGKVESDGTLADEDIERLEKRLSEYSGAKIVLERGAEREDGLRVEVEDLGIELSYSKERVKADLLAFIQQAL
jgi:F-type H+-transporting ATPase subunit delta